MTRLVVSHQAQSDVERLCDFLESTLPEEAARTADVLADGLDILRRHPGVGRPVEEGLRELVISRGKTGYVALYLFDEEADAVIVLALRHQRESGYRLT
ncbi:MAG: type II toxin-antitoxin system RelE/ParE family toxin [Burkholderiales bacterium]|nr:type II toxin-antitoxin system RelE/ParE family toxin [Burkholderiales bacterium]